MTFEEIKQELRTINILAVSKALGLREKLNLNENNRGNCITGHPSESQACFSIEPDRGFFHCFSCGRGGDTIKLVMLSKRAGFFAACMWLAETFCPHLVAELRRDLTEADPIKRKAAIKSHIYHEIFVEAKEALLSPAGELGFKYLTETRRYDPELLPDVDFGFIADDSVIRATLKERYASMPDGEEWLEILSTLHIMSDDEPPAIVVPAFTRYGRITGLLKRHIPMEGAETKGGRWFCTLDTNKSDPLFLHRYKNVNTLTVVEGIFDAAYMQALGIETVALGQAVLTDRHIEGLKEKGVSRVIIALDNDLPGANGECTGLKNTMAAVTTCIKAGLEPLVIDPRRLNDGAGDGINIKDPDEYFRHHGAEALSQFIRTTAEPGVQWQVRRQAELYPVTDPLQRSNFIVACCDMYGSVPGEFPRLKGDLLKEVSAVTGIDENDVHVEFESAKAIKNQRESDASLIRILSRGIQHKNLKILLDELRRFSSIATKDDGLLIPEFDFDTTFNRALTGNVEGLKTGLSCFDGPDDMPRYRIKLGGITIIAGDSGVGKTTLLLNLFLNMIELYPDKTFVFITYEEATEALLFKLINIKAGVDLQNGTNNHAIIRHLRNTPSEEWKPRLKEAVNTMRGYSQARRLWLLNENYEINNLANVIKQLCNKNNVGAIFIDYMQKIPSNGEFGSQQLRLQRISDMLRATTQEVGCAVIIGSQINKDGQVRESMDIYHDANLVVKISKTTQYDLYEAGLGEKPDKKNCDTIIDGYRTLVVDKSRDSENGKKMVLAFNGPVLKLSSLDNSYNNWNL